VSSAEPDLKPLESVCERIEAAPESGVSLLLYGLLKSMQIEERGCPFALTRLRMLDADTRTLVYALMELHAQQANHSPEWMALVERMDEVVNRGASGAGG
jgi:DNA polymerase III psi subunit